LPEAERLQRYMHEARKEILMKTIVTIAAAVLFVGSGLAMNLAHAQQSGIGRTDVLRHDLAENGRELIQVRVDFAPGAAFGMHTHPGEEVAYVLEGSLEYQLEGKPPVTLKAGDSLFIPAGTPHAARNVGSVNAAELATYLVDKGKPLVVLRQVSAR
jgi:quercetin dioxygenase-like cupin family protein